MCCLLPRRVYNAQTALALHAAAGYNERIPVNSESRDLYVPWQAFTPHWRHASGRARLFIDGLASRSTKLQLI